MSKPPFRLPAMNALVAFEAAARHVSFARAARELNVTAAAISHQVKALEVTLQCPLFQRHHRGVSLTEAGAYLMVALQRGFETMAEATEQLRRRASAASVTIGVTTAVSSLWLTPRLAAFWKTHGDVSIAQIVSDTDAPPGQCDLSIRYDVPPKGEAAARVLFRDRLMALGSPGFARARRIGTLADLAAAPLIHFDSPVTDWTDWQGWFRAQGHDGPVRQGNRVNNYLIALQAACDDMGAVLGWVSLARPFLEKRQLVPLLPDAVTPRAAFLVTLHNQTSPRARLVHDWLASQASAATAAQAWPAA